VLAVAAALAAGATVIASPLALAGQPEGPARPGVQRVASGPARSLGEPAAARGGTVTAVTATNFCTAGARAQVWTRRAAAGWRTGTVLPAGFGSSYDPSAAASPGGPLLVVAGTAPAGQECIASGSVAIATVGQGGALSEPRLVSDQRGTGSFERPRAAAAPPCGRPAGTATADAAPAESPATVNGLQAQGEPGA
jgi:hypothetical protein